MTIMTAAGSPRVSKITEYLQGDDAPRWSLWLTSPRCEVAYKVFNLGNALERLAGRIHRDLQDNDHDSIDTWAYEAGKRAGAREVMRIARLSYDAGVATARQAVAS
jgi:hypothetical protein